MFFNKKVAKNVKKKKKEEEDTSRRYVIFMFRIFKIRMAGVQWLSKTFKVYFVN